MNKRSEEKNIEINELADEDVNSDELIDEDIKLDYDEIINEEIEGISTSLAEQVNEEFIDNEDNNKKKKFNLKKAVIIASSTFLSLSLILVFLVYTPLGNNILKKLGGKIWALSTNKFDDNIDKVEDFDDIDEDDTKNKEPLEEIKVEDIVFRNVNGQGRHEDYVYNILLLGEEAIGSGGSRGRTDVIMIASINTKTKSLKLTSLMRDSYVQIPGYNDNKINSAYTKGGVELLYETIAKNFDIRLDGCVLVNFANFEKIIDALGGVEIELTEAEARYLNTKNYISDKKNRNVVVGKQIMNGNQALGYSRIRYRKAITGNNNDYGRTDRHRLVLNAIFERYKNLNNAELITMMYKMLPMITTDISSKEFEFLLTKYLETGARKIDQLRIPIDGAFRDDVSVRGMDALVLDYDKNISALHEFIFGDVKETLGTTESLNINNINNN